MQLESAGIVAICAVGAKTGSAPGMVYHHVSVEDGCQSLSNFVPTCSWSESWHRGINSKHTQCSQLMSDKMDVRLRCFVMFFAGSTGRWGQLDVPLLRFSMRLYSSATSARCRLGTLQGWHQPVAMSRGGIPHEIRTTDSTRSSRTLFIRKTCCKVSARNVQNVFNVDMNFRQFLGTVLVFSFHISYFNVVHRCPSNFQNDLVAFQQRLTDQAGETALESSEVVR